MSEQNTTPAAAPAKPKRPKSKSQLMAGALLDKAYNDAIEAKARGEKIGWATSLFPQEIAETLGLNIVYPENHGAAVAAKKLAEPFLHYAEAHGCNNDLCSYAKIDRSIPVPQPPQNSGLPSPTSHPSKEIQPWH